MIDSAKTKNSFEVRILRQDAPRQPSYWERHRVLLEPGMNVISVLQRIAANASTVEGRHVAPVAWDCNCLEEVCGACTMLINGHVRQACSAIVEKLLEDSPEIELRPMSKFPVVRDLVVDRGRLFHSLKEIKAWVPVDGYYDMGPGPRQSQAQQEELYPLSQCMSCGCCLDACPQYQKIELQRAPGESEQSFQRRQQQAYDDAFMGAHALNQAVLFNSNPIGKYTTDQRLEALVSAGGVQTCGNAQNCVAVCPKQIPVTTSIAKDGRAVTLYKLKKYFDR